MRVFIDITGYPGITDMNDTHCVIDGKLYNMRISKYKQYTASIPCKWLKNKIPCVLSNCDQTKLVFSYSEDSDKYNYSNIKYMGEVCTEYWSGKKVLTSRGGGYRRYIKRYSNNDSDRKR